MGAALVTAITPVGFPMPDIHKKKLFQIRVFQLLSLTYHQPLRYQLILLGKVVQLYTTMHSLLSLY